MGGGVFVKTLKNATEQMLGQYYPKMLVLNLNAHWINWISIIDSLPLIWDEDKH